MDGGKNMSKGNLTFAEYAILGIAFELSIWNFLDIHDEGINYFFHEFLPTWVSALFFIVLIGILVYCIYYLMKRIAQLMETIQRERHEDLIVKLREAVKCLKTRA